MSKLDHAIRAIDHGEKLSEEAYDLGELELGNDLNIRARDLAEHVDAAIEINHEVPEAKRAKLLAQSSLQAIFNDITLELERQLDSPTVRRLTPTTALDIGERTRFRLRRLDALDVSKVEPLRVRMHQALNAYEIAIDVYLMTATESLALREQAIQVSQLFRLELERAKAKLLTLAEWNSDQWRRIKRRTVRTKRARWLAPLGTPTGRVREALESALK